MISAFVAFIHELIAAREQRNKRKQARLEQLMKIIIEMTETIKDQQIALKEMCQDCSFDLSHFDNVQEARRVPNNNNFVIRNYLISQLEIQNEQKLKMIEELEMMILERNENLEKSTKQKPAAVIMKVYQEIYEDLESEELNAGSNMITTTAEVHSHGDPAAASLDGNINSSSRNPQSCVFGDSLEDITIIE